MTAPTNWGSISGAAQRKNISIPTMRRYIAQGLVYAERVGPKLIRVDLNSVDALGTPMQAAGGGDE